MAILIIVAAFFVSGLIAGQMMTEAKERWEAEQEARAYRWLKKKQERLEQQPWIPPNYEGPLPENVPQYGIVDLTTGEII